MLFLAGVALRATALPLAGVRDMRDFKVWTYNAATLGPTEVYGNGGWPPRWRTLTYGRVSSRADYPPLALGELAVVGRLYRGLFPAFPDTTALVVAIKLLVVVADVALAALIFRAVRSRAGVGAGRWAAAAFWANPAVLLQGAVLGYLDPLFALPAVGAVVAASSGMAAAAGALLAVSCLTKPQGILVLPAVALALSPLAAGQWRALRSAAFAAGLVSIACVAPLIYADGFLNMCVAVAHLLTDGWLSANALNIWWLASGGQLIGVKAFVAGAGANPSMWATAVVALGASAVAAAVAWAMWHARGARDLPRMAALAAFTVHAYVILAVQVHENHLYLALPFLAVVAATRRQYRGLLFSVSAIAALNLDVFYGLGDGVGYQVPRGVTGIDLTVVLAVVNCLALAWHAAVFRREWASAPDALPAGS